MARFEDEKLPPDVPPVTYAPREPRLRRPPFVFIARGNLQEDDHYSRGYTITTGADGKPQPKFFDGFPQRRQVDRQLIERGQQRFNIYCSVCHGLDGYGKGQIEIRSEQLGTPLNAKSLHDDTVRARSDGHIFNTITNGIRNMPSYSAQIPLDDRWAIVAYVRALQLSQNAPAQLVENENDGQKDQTQAMSRQ